MKKNICYILVVLFLFLTKINVKAVSLCTYEDQAKLNNISANVKVSYEEATGTLDPNKYITPEIYIGTDKENAPITYNYFKINIINITKDLYVKISNNLNSNVNTINYSDTTDGLYSYDWKDLSKVAELTIDVYSSKETNCPNELYYKSYFTVPRVNEHSFDDVCSENADYYLCQKYVTYDPIDYDSFYEKMDTYVEEKLNIENSSSNETNKTFFQKIIAFISKQKYIFIGVLAVIILFTIIMIIKSKKNRSDLL